jgi:hypothetical protein
VSDEPCTSQGYPEIHPDGTWNAAPKSNGPRPEQRAEESAPGLAEWFIFIRNQETGPFTVDEMKARVAAGSLHPSSFVRNQKTGWAYAQDHPILRAMLTAKPPLPDQKPPETLSPVVSPPKLPPSARASGGPSVIAKGTDCVDDRQQSSPLSQERSVPALPAGQAAAGFPHENPAMRWTPAPTTATPGRTAVPAKSARAATSRLLRPDEWFAWYISPYEALQIEEVVREGEHKGKTIQRAKKILLQEIELNDGKVGWLDNCTLDRSRAQKLDDELLDPIKARYHWFIYQDKSLLRFLTRGDIDCFLCPDSDSHELTLAQMDEEPDFRAFLSKPFAGQYNALLARAIKDRTLRIVQAFFDARYWVQRSGEDACFEGTSRRVEEIVASIRSKEVEGRTRKPSLPEIEAYLREQSLPDLFNLLPTAFTSHQRDVVATLLQLAVTCNNKHDDPELAKAVLRLCKRFTCRDVALSERLETSFKTIDENISYQQLAARLEGLVELMGAKANEGQERKLSLGEMETFLRQHSYVEVFSPQSPEYAPFQGALIATIRQLAITCYNAHGDAELSKCVLSLCRRFPCPDAELSKRLDEDFTAINEIISRQRLGKQSLAQSQGQQRPEYRTAIAWLVVIAVVIAIGTIAKHFDSTKPASTGREPNQTPPAKPEWTPPPSKPASPVKSAEELELDRERQVIDREKASAASMANELETLAKAIRQERLYLDSTNQFAVDAFNRKVDAHNALLEKLRAQNRYVNQLVDSYNEKVRQQRR